MHVHKPAVILVRPQLPENIGTCFRALWNCEMTDLRLVKPKTWPHEKAVSAAAGAGEHVLKNVRVFPTLQEALSDLNYVVATTARPRDMVKPVYDLPQFWSTLTLPPETRVGVMFGPERTGLTSEDLSWAQGILSIPLNPVYSSLNIAQAVLLVAYGWWSLYGEAATPPKRAVNPGSSKRLASPLAAHAELWGFFEHFESLVDASGFFYPPKLRPNMVRNLRNIFTRANLTEQEVRTLRGIVSRLEKKIF